MHLPNLICQRRRKHVLPDLPVRAVFPVTIRLDLGRMQNHARALVSSAAGKFVFRPDDESQTRWRVLVAHELSLAEARADVVDHDAGPGGWEQRGELARRVYLKELGLAVSTQRFS